MGSERADDGTEQSAASDVDAKLSDDVELVSVAAVADNGVIGSDGELPWESIPADKRQYRTRVADAPVLLGRRTFESMLEDLPGAAQIVLSRTERAYDVATAHHAGDVDAALSLAADLAADLGSEAAYVIGGEAIYELFQPHVDRMVLSRIPGEYEGEHTFPAWDESEWRRCETVDYEAFVLEEWVRTDR